VDWATIVAAYPLLYPGGGEYSVNLDVRRDSERHVSQSHHCSRLGESTTRKILSLK